MARLSQPYSSCQVLSTSLARGMIPLGDALWQVLCWGTHTTPAESIYIGGLCCCFNCSCLMLMPFVQQLLLLLLPLLLLSLLLLFRQLRRSLLLLLPLRPLLLLKCTNRYASRRVMYTSTLVPMWAALLFSWPLLQSRFNSIRCQATFTSTNIAVVIAGLDQWSPTTQQCNLPHLWTMSSQVRSASWDNYLWVESI